MKYLKQNAGCIYPGVLGGHEGHTTKSCCPLRFTLLVSWKSEKSYMHPSLFVCQLYWYRSKHNNNEALCITFNSCKTASTYSMALATVNIDKIVKMTSASSYVYPKLLLMGSNVTIHVWSGYDHPVLYLPNFNFIDLIFFEICGHKIQISWPRCYATGIA